MSINIPRAPYTRWFCPNCHNILFEFKNTLLDSLIGYGCALQKFDKMCKKHKSCKHCGFVFDDMDIKVYCYHNRLYPFWKDWPIEQQKELINGVKNRYKYSEYQYWMPEKF